MPQIATYENKENISPSSEGAEVTAQSAYKIDEFTQRAASAVGVAIGHVGEAVKSVGEAIDKHDTQMEISQGSAGLAGLTTSLTSQWNDIASHTDPNQIAQAAKAFQDNVLTPSLAKFSDGFTTDSSREWASEHISSLSDHFSTVLAADTSSAAGAALKQNIAATADAYANTVHADPSALDLALKQTSSSITALVNNAHGLDFKTANDARTSMLQDAQSGLVVAGIKGMIDKNVDAGVKMLEDPKYAQYLTAAQQDTLHDYARTTLKFNQEQARLDTTNGILAQLTASNDATNAVLGSLKISPDGTVQAPPNTLQKILQNPAIKGSSKLPLITFITKNSDPTAVTQANPDPDTYSALADQAAHGQLSYDQAIQAHNKGLINNQQLSFLTTSNKDATDNPAVTQANGQLKNFIDLMKPVINPTSMGGIPADPGSVQNFVNFQLDMSQKFQAGLKAGLTPAQMLNSHSPNYIAKNLSAYTANSGYPGAGSGSGGASSSDSNSPPPPAY